MNKLSEKSFTQILTFAGNYKLGATWIALILITAILAIFPGDAEEIMLPPIMILYLITPYILAKRKGKNPWKWAFLCAFVFPCWFILLFSKDESPVSKAPKKELSKSKREIDQETLGDFYEIMNLKNDEKAQLKRTYGSIRKMQQASDKDLNDMGFTKRQITTIRSHKK